MRNFLTSGLVRWSVTAALVIYAASYLTRDDIRELTRADYFVLLFLAAAVLVVVVVVNAVRWLLVAHTLALRLRWPQSLQ